MRNTFKYSVAFVLFLPICSLAKPQDSSLSPNAQIIVNEAADLLFGSQNTAMPLVDFNNTGTTGIVDTACPQTEYGAWGRWFTNGKILSVSQGVFCDTNQIIDTQMSLPPEKRKPNYPATIAFQIISDLSKTPITKYGLERYTKGYFARSGNYCQLWLARNKIGKIELAIVRIKAKSPEVYTSEDNLQKECYIRGQLAGFGLEGGATLPFNRLAYRSPVPLGLSYATVTHSGIRQRTKMLVSVVFFALSNEMMSEFRRGPFDRKKFIDLLSTSPQLEPIAQRLPFYEDLERRERAVKNAPSPVLGAPPVVPNSN